MATFHLEIVSMDGKEFEGEVERVRLRTMSGDIAILANHTNYCTAVGMGTAVVRMADGSERRAAAIGGMISVMNKQCRLITTTWEWEEEINVDRAEAARKRAEERLSAEALTEEEKQRIRAKLYRALIRIQTASREYSSS